jgi:Flp pilus assembly protein TadD
MSGPLVSAADAVVRDALAALRRGDFAVAEQKLGVELQAHPNDGPVLSLLAVALAGQHKAKEAEAVHRRALANSPNSPDALNNYANHLLGVGDEEGARKTYLKLAAADTSHRNANVQLTRLANKRKSVEKTMRYIKHIRNKEDRQWRMANNHKKNI